MHTESRNSLSIPNSLFEPPKTTIICKIQPTTFLLIFIVKRWPRFKKQNEQEKSKFCDFCYEFKKGIYK